MVINPQKRTQNFFCSFDYFSKLFYSAIDLATNFSLILGGSEGRPQPGNSSLGAPLVSLAPIQFDLFITALPTFFCFLKACK